MQSDTTLRVMWYHLTDILHRSYPFIFTEAAEEGAFTPEADLNIELAQRK